MHGIQTLHLVVSGIGCAEQKETWRCDIDSPTSVLQLTSNGSQKDGGKTHTVFRISTVHTCFCEGVENPGLIKFGMRDVNRAAHSDVQLLKYVAEQHLAPVRAM